MDFLNVLEPLMALIILYQLYCQMSSLPIILTVIKDGMSYSRVL